MKSLATYLECDGAATPASTTGMGNPMAPGPDGSVGSGDTFDHQKTAKAKKEKRRKSDKEVRWDKKPESLQAFMEGIMDVDIDVDDLSLIPSIINLNTPMATIETQLKTLFKTNKKLAQQTKFKTTGNWVCFMHDHGEIYMELIDGSDKEVISFFPGRSKAIDYDISMCDLDDIYSPEEAVQVYGNAPWESWKIKDKTLWKALIHNSYKVFNVTSNG